MKIDKVVLEDFRQYKDTNEIDLSVSNERNIVLIGGLNGYGKTNLLVAFVWCLYGENIEKTDTQFRNQIRKSGNYPKFLKQNLNFDSEKSGKTDYKVELHLSEVDLPMSEGKGKCIIKRSVDTNNLQENFLIEIVDDDKIVLDKTEDKIDFINEFIVPIDASKFIFFNAEKISNMAELSIREEGELMNDALSNILGLDIYEGLVDDLNVYIDQLRKDSTKGDLKTRIESNELEEKIKRQEIEDNNDEILKLRSQKEELETKIKAYDEFINANSKSDGSKVNLSLLYGQQKEYKDDIKELEEEFNNIIELVPFAICGPLLEETVEQLEKQSHSYGNNESSVFIKVDQFVEELFNKPEFPKQEDDLSFRGKLFYSEKARDVILRLFKDNDDENHEEVNIIHDLTNADEELLTETYSLVKNSMNVQIDTVITNLISAKQRLNKIENKIKNFESEKESDEIISYRDRKESATETIGKLNQEIGKYQSLNESLNEQINLIKNTRGKLLRKSELTKRKKELDAISNYVAVLNEFIVQEKENKSSRIADNIYDELQTLMHKMAQGKSFLSKVLVKPLPDNEGLNITLINDDNEEVDKDSLSEGEKQLYISALIKALIKEAFQDFPIIIDTPLGRLDQSHKNEVLKKFYPSLAGQVILMATDSEIPLRRKELIDHTISHTYRLVNENNNTSIKTGYFTK